jgi:hypothetical protein
VERSFLVLRFRSGLSDDLLLLRYASWFTFCGGMLDGRHIECKAGRKVRVPIGRVAALCDILLGIMAKGFSISLGD